MNDQEINDVTIKDDKGINLPWSYIFFLLHKHCNINKWQIMEYTLPQITELMDESGKYMQFEVSSKVPMMGGVPFVQGGQPTEEFEEATEEDINDLASFLGG
jgi:hypothetical protein